MKFLSTNLVTTLSNMNTKNKHKKMISLLMAGALLNPIPVIASQTELEKEAKVLSIQYDIANAKAALVNEKLYLTKLQDLEKKAVSKKEDDLAKKLDQAIKLSEKNVKLFDRLSHGEIKFVGVKFINPNDKSEWIMFTDEDFCVSKWDSKGKRVYIREDGEVHEKSSGNWCGFSVSENKMYLIGNSGAYFTRNGIMTKEVRDLIKEKEEKEAEKRKKTETPSDSSQPEENTVFGKRVRF